MAGIYIHIPFCRQACHYCNFHFSTSLKLQNDFLDALLKEMILQKNYVAGEPVDTIYFGGGTPSLLTATALSAIMETIYSTYTIADTAEITFEANPDDISESNLQLWKKSGINRLSIGVQSFFDEDLIWMNRAHTASQANDSIMRAQDAGFVNMSIDLIYGTPGLSDSKWADNMQHAAELLIPHLSCYALTVEPGTPLDSMTKKKKVQPVSNDAQALQFMMMTDFFQEKGYEHYEISNLSMPGKRSIHNSSYWSGSKYLGLGPSAHSFNGKSRQWNIANNALYIQSLKNGSIPFEIEMLTETQRYNEYIMTSLRKMEGVDIGHIKNFFGSKYSNELIQASKKFIDKKWIDKDKADNLPGTLILTREGKLFADHIASALFG
jgi:oxygen-independent coproporphyrinogen-3 oxidase